MLGFSITPQIVVPLGIKYIALGLIENNTLSLDFDDYTGLADRSGCQFFKLPVDDSYIVSLDTRDTKAELTLMKRIGSVPAMVHFDINNLEKIYPGQIDKTPSSVILVALPNNWQQIGQAEFSLMRQRISDLTGQMETIETDFKILPGTPENLEKAHSDWRYLKYATTSAHYKKLLDFKLALDAGQQYHSLIAESPTFDHHTWSGARFMATKITNTPHYAVNLKFSDAISSQTPNICRATSGKKNDHAIHNKLMAINNNAKITKN